MFVRYSRGNPGGKLACSHAVEHGEQRICHEAGAQDEEQRQPRPVALGKDITIYTLGQVVSQHKFWGWEVNCHLKRVIGYVT